MKKSNVIKKSLKIKQEATKECIVLPADELYEVIRQSLQNENYKIKWKMKYEIKELRNNFGLTRKNYPVYLHMI